VDGWLALLHHPRQNHHASDMYILDCAVVDALGAVDSHFWQHSLYFSKSNHASPDNIWRPWLDLLIANSPLFTFQYFYCRPVLPGKSCIDFGGYGEWKFSTNVFLQLTDINEK
jgi:hypothetical protein